MKADVHGPVPELRAKATDKEAPEAELTVESRRRGHSYTRLTPDGRARGAVAVGMLVHGEESYRTEPTPFLQGVFESEPKAVTALHARAGVVVGAHRIRGASTGNARPPSRVVE
ncbi:hypothetical protein [Streptomyces europaeiscabiei]|uniref:hypothetical protein n=1 Tax=Streptomyces europaeiscabiei TaxID=146819 RepID=UPI0038F6F609